MVRVDYGHSHETKPKTQQEKLYMDIETGEVVLVYRETDRVEDGVFNPYYYFSFSTLKHQLLSAKKETNLVPYDGSVTLVNKQ